ncbi:MAG: HAD hydrolase-like protein, partial [Atopobiaceae bacterium]|nr:HAD hydrolase-like protein [Atopobiaceae bacterium]
MYEAGDLASRKAIIFDFDGTIADTKASIIMTASTVLAQWGVTDEELSRVGEIIGPPFPQAFQWVFGFSLEDAIEITRRYRVIYEQLGVYALPAFEGMCELLRELRREGRLLAVASSKRTYLVRRGLDDNGIVELFDSVRAKETDLESTKADAIRLVLEDLGVTADEAVMVGDRFHDVEAAK